MRSRSVPPSPARDAPAAVGLPARPVPAGSRYPGARRGLTLTEVVVATALLGAVTAGTLPVLHGVRQVRRELDLRRTATVELTNALDALAARPVGELPPGPLADIPLRPGFAERLDAPQWSVEAFPPDGGGGIRLTASLSWLDRGGTRVSPLRLSAWAFRDDGPAAGDDR